MSTINRKVVEDYYESEWANLITSKTLDLLVELTCKAYHLNQPQSINYMREKEIPRLNRLGQI